MKKIGLALGGGGAKGLAHISMLEVFDEFGVKPHCIAGTSIGSVVGSLYAAGLTGIQIRERVSKMIISKGDSFRDMLHKKDVLKWIEFLDIDFRSRGLFKGDKFIKFLYNAIGVSTFEELQIPLKIVATNFWTSEQVVLDKGELMPAVKASMGLPGVFTPVKIGEQVLIDGGGVNPVPHDVLENCDVIIAIDVMGRMSKTSHKTPNLLRSVLGMFDIMQNSIIKQKNLNNKPDIYIKPDITGVDLLEFFKANEIYAQAKTAQDQLRQAMSKIL